MSAVTYRDGVATIEEETCRTEVYVGKLATIILAGDVMSLGIDTLALAAGFLAMQQERNDLIEEVAALRRGKVGKEHAGAMQGARKVLSELNAAVDQFMAMYDQGDGPDSTAEGALRNMMGAAISWLISDSTAATERANLLEGGA